MSDETPSFKPGDRFILNVGAAEVHGVVPDISCQTFHYVPERPMIEDGVTEGYYVVMEGPDVVAHSERVAMVALDGEVMVEPLEKP